MLQNVMVNGWFSRLVVYLFLPHFFLPLNFMLTAVGSDLWGVDACPFSPDKRDKHDRSIRIENNSQCTHSEPSRTECPLDIVTHCSQQTAPEDSKEDDVFSRRPFILLGTPPMTSWAIWSNRLPFHTCFIHRSCRLHSQMCALVCKRGVP